MKAFKILWFVCVALISMSATDFKSHIQKDETPLVKYLKMLDVENSESGVDGIDCIYVINLDSRPDKWERVKRVFDQRGIRVNRVSGVNGWELTEEQLKEMCGPYAVHMPRGHYGCLLSHLSVLKDAHDRGFDRIWVMEDDVDFLEDSAQIPQLLRRLSQFDEEWDIFYTDVDFRKSDGSYLKSVAYCPRFDQKLLPRAHYQQRVVIDDELMRIYQRYATTSMIFSKKGIKKVLDYFSHVYVWEAIDGELHWIPDIREYASRRDLVSNWTSSPHSDTVSKPPTLGTHIDDYLRFWAQYHRALLQEKNSEDAATFCASYYKVAHLFPKRGEPLYRLAAHYRLKDNYLLGYLIAKSGCDLSCPKDTELVEKWVYQWGLKLEASLCAYYLGKYDECKEISDEMLKDPQLPPHIRKQVQENLSWVYPKLENRSEAPPTHTANPIVGSLKEVWTSLKGLFSNSLVWGRG